MSISPKKRGVSPRAGRFGNNASDRQRCSEIVVGKERLRAGALLLIDAINGFDFEGSGGLVKAATRAAPQIRKLAARARTAGIPVIYVNDNFGRWRSDFRATIAGCTSRNQPGRKVAARLLPADGDLFVLKPQHSGFFCTPLELLLGHLAAETLILAGFSANSCLLFTANDAHMRRYRLIVPSDCTGSNTLALTDEALRYVRTTLHAMTPRGDEIEFSGHDPCTPSENVGQFAQQGRPRSSRSPRR